VAASEQPSDERTYPIHPEALPPPQDIGRFRVAFARTRDDLRSVQRLRFEVFNLELGEGLDESFATGLDSDRFDPVCHHLIVTDLKEDRVIGTYRMQSGEMAERHHGFYSADEFDLAGLPPDVLRESIEVGRACVAQPYRNRQVLFLLWKGLAAYLQRNRKRYLFGCCSLTSQDPVEGWRVMDHLVRHEHVRTDLRVEPQPAWRCYPDTFAPAVAPDAPPVEVPKLFSLYLRYGGQVCGPPALDRYFKTIDYLVLLDVERLDAESREMFFR
jgi:putative hemolysin